MDTSLMRTSTRPQDPSVQEVELPSVSRAAGTAFAGAVTACLLLLLAAEAAGVDFEVTRSDGRAVSVTFSSVTITLMLAAAAGTAMLATVGRRSRRAWTGVAFAGLALGVASVALPLISTAEPLTVAVLVAMHVLSGVIWCAVLIWMLRRS